MHFRAIASLCLLLDASAWAASIPAGHAVHEKREVPASGWVKRSRLDSSVTLPLRFALTQSNLDRGYDYLMDVSHPESSNYGKHWTKEQIDAAFAPSEDAANEVVGWLSNAGIDADRRLHGPGTITVGVTADEAERLLKTEYYGWEHTATGHRQAGCDQYHLPEAIRKHVDFITPGINLLSPVKDKKKYNRDVKRSSNEPAWAKPMISDMPAGYQAPANDADLSNCDNVITPACIRALYKVPKPTTAYPGNQLGIFENGDFFAQEDLNLFFANYTPYIPVGTFPVVDSIDGGQAPVALNEAGGESSLDLQLSFPLIYPQSITVFQTDDFVYSDGNFSANPASGGYNTWLDAIDGSYCTYSAFGITGDSSIDPQYPDLAAGGYKGQLECGVFQPTNVMSVSYSRQEFDHPVNYQKRQCNEFMKLALAGHTIFFSSGDTGVAGRPGDPSKHGCLGSNNTIFNPRWPDSCPYLTVVGATQIYQGFTVDDPESVANDPFENYSSGGGFSNIFPIPDFQQKAVAKYFRDHSPPYPYYSGDETLGCNGGLYNRSGRGYPDVSANGMNIAVYVGGKAVKEGGTSASTPIFASIITRVNEERLAANKSTVGFINPVLYSHPHVLNDIKNGTNPGCGTNGFAAVEGWDPSSGLGTPNFPKMVELFLSLP